MTELRRYAVVIAWLAPVGCQTVPPSDPVVLRLHGLEVHKSDFDAHLAELETRGVTVDGAEVRRALGERFLEEHVLVLEARRRGFLEAGASAEDAREAVRWLVAETVVTTPEVDEAAIERYYEAHRDALRSPETITVSQILVATLNEARDVRRRLSRDRRSFELLARTMSVGPEAESGGLMGTFARGQLPTALEDEAFRVRPGQFSRIIETALGFHVLRIDAQTSSQERTLEECRDEIHSRLMEQAREKTAREYVARLLAEAEVDHAALYADTAAR